MDEFVNAPVTNTYMSANQSLDAANSVSSNLYNAQNSLNARTSLKKQLVSNPVQNHKILNDTTLKKKNPKLKKVLLTMQRGPQQFPNKSSTSRSLLKITWYSLNVSLIGTLILKIFKTLQKQLTQYSHQQIQEWQIQKFR